ncbi:ABC transporter ATP-binding protein [Reichenbachiella sp. MALMAid0571]|uniref:ABC transporter ATP-binding protein n=1 Tax=Reichenbachiella sp. MALMAid0571 TaxID=3143939 RepID=UPI0032DFF1A2
MEDYAIKISDLSKKYQIGQLKSTSLRESLFNFSKTKEENYFWALKDINLTIQPGEAVGIIGKNGAGKSTLLKILSKITYPTSGKVEINGRVSSLLEVGTGFHPELSGRENVFLNGTILGMRRNEIKSKFDEIVDFSGVGNFIDTPIKHYSSGMKVRLAFAVAAFLEPEILIIDEVLAVGDADFQKKCLGKMEEVTGEGRTVLFVSHNMGAIEKLCTSGIQLNNGMIQTIGNIQEIITSYMQFNTSSVQRHSIKERRGNGALIVESLRITNEFGIEIHQIKSDMNIRIEMDYSIQNHAFDFSRLIVGIGIKDFNGDNLLLHHNRLTGQLFNNSQVLGSHKIIFTLDNLGLNVGDYSIHYSVMQDTEYIDHSDQVLTFEVTSQFPFNYQELPPKSSSKFLRRAEWSIE